MPEETHLDRLEKEIEQADYITASILSMEAYDIDHGLCMHDERDGPLSLVTMHPGEDWYSGGRFEKLVHRFRMRKVHKHFGCSLFELLEQPRYVVESVLADALKAEEEEAKRTNNALNQLTTPDGTPKR